MIGCVRCHLGDPRADDAATAHAGMEVLSGDLSTVSRTCGTAACHADEAARVNASAMAGARGILAVDRFAFGERSDPVPRPEDDLRSLRPATHPGPNAEDHVRKLCAPCHLGHRKERPGEAGFAARGGGCAACHLAPPEPGAMAGNGPLHPGLTARVTDDRCEGCHARSGRIALSYRGVVELEPGDPRVTRTLPDGRPAGDAPSDVHARAGLACIDCHTERDLMGDGRAHAFAREAVGVSCEDCHRPTARAMDPAARATAMRLRAAWLRSGGAALAELDDVLVTRGGAPLWRARAAGNVLHRALDGRPQRIPVWRPAAHHTLPGHDRLRCQACHTQWAPRCPSCHTASNPAGRQFDHVARAERPGAWEETGSHNGYGPPALAVGTGGGIEPFVEGMTMVLQGTRTPGNRVLWAPLDAHTTGPARPCRACHAPDDVDATLPTVGGTTRPGARLLAEAERTRITRIGPCLACHPRAEDPVWSAGDVPVRAGSTSGTWRAVEGASR